MSNACLWREATVTHTTFPVECSLWNEFPKRDRDGGAALSRPILPEVRCAVRGVSTTPAADCVSFDPRHVGMVLPARRPSRRTAEAWAVRRRA